MSATQLELRRRPTPGSGRWDGSEVANALYKSAGPVLGGVIQKNPPASFSCARQGIRKLVDIARVLVYDHGDMSGDRRLTTLASDLLRVVDTERRGSEERPIFFLCHSVGGLVVKFALTQASRHSTYQPLLRSCHGIGFFATPHRGSKFLASEYYKPSIERLLKLAGPLPSTLMRDLAPESPALLKVDETFKELASEIRVWSFYEATNSRLLEKRESGAKEVQLKTVISSMRSTLLGLRHEKVYGLQATHASCAGFGKDNAETARLFLDEFASAVEAADELNRNSMVAMHIHTKGGIQGVDLHASLKLQDQERLVKIHGFYEPDPFLTVEAGSSLRVFVTGRSLSDFYKEAPEQLLQERLDNEDRESEVLKRATSLHPPSAAALSLAIPVSADERRFEKRSATNQPRTGRPPLSLTRSHEVLSPTVDDGNIDNSDLGTSHPLAIQGGDVPSKISEQQEIFQEPISTKFLPNEASQGNSSSVIPKRPRSEKVPNSPIRSPVIRFIETSIESQTRRDDQERRKSSGAAKEPRPDSVAHLQSSRGRLLSASRVPADSPCVSIQDYDLREGSAVTDNPARPSLHTHPSKETPKFVWIHVPANNPSWVPKVLEALSSYQKMDLSELLNEEHWKSRHARGRHSQHHACFLKSTCAFASLKYKLPQYGPGSARTVPHRSDRRTSTESIQQDPPTHCLYLYFPFLHFDSYKTLIRRRDMIRRRMKQGRTCPVPKDVQDNSSFELRMIWEFLGHDPPVNCRRTLDQYRYPSLRDTRARDDDQMLYKMTKQSMSRAVERRSTSFRLKNEINRVGRQFSRHSEENSEDGGDGADSDDIFSVDSGREQDLDGGNGMQDVLDGNVLMVDQLWLWAIDSSEDFIPFLCFFLWWYSWTRVELTKVKATLLTFFPTREGNPMEGPLYQQADLRDSIFNEVNTDLTRHCENALDLAALTVLHAVSVLIDRSSHPDLEIFRIFEEAISVLTERMTSSLKGFRTAGLRNRHVDGSDVELNTSTIRKRHRKEDERDEEENQDNTSALLELRDIEDELSTLKSLFGEQEQQVNVMLKIYEEHFSIPGTSPMLGRTSSAPVLSPSSERSSGPWSAPSTAQPLSTGSGKACLLEATAKLKSYLSQTDDMIERVQKTRHDFDKLLTTVQRQAQIDEVRLSRQQADLASAQERSVMIFTVFTVIFLPLSFFSSIFGMNTYEWGGAGNLRLRTIGVIALPASAALVVVALVVAWSTSMRKTLNYPIKGIRKCKQKVSRWCRTQLLAAWYGKDGTPRLDVERIRPRTLQKQRRGKLPRTKTGGHDFWGKYRLQNDSDYEIPKNNLMSTYEKGAKARRVARKTNKW